MKIILKQNKISNLLSIPGLFSSLAMLLFLNVKIIDADTLDTKHQKNLPQIQNMLNVGFFNEKYLN